MRLFLEMERRRQRQVRFDARRLVGERPAVFPIPLRSTVGHIFPGRRGVGIADRLLNRTASLVRRFAVESAFGLFETEILFRIDVLGTALNIRLDIRVLLLIENLHG